MIRINLLREKKKNKRSGEGKGSQSLLVGVMGLIGAAAAVFFLLHMPLSAEIDEIKAENTKRTNANKKLADETKEFPIVEAQVKAAEAQKLAIERLNAARAVPSWMLFELSSILTKDHKPTMTVEMANRVNEDPNRKFGLGWDPKRIWLTSIEEKDGIITITGGAQATADVTQLALRLQASVFFREIAPTKVAQEIDNQTKQSFYAFSIAGRVMY